MKRFEGRGDTLKISVSLAAGSCPVKQQEPAEVALTNSLLSALNE
jgi:hypothetical protein